MFIKKSWATSSGKKYITYQIVESYRPKDAKYTKHRILANITKLPLALIEKIELLLKSPNPSIITDLKDFFKKSYIYGPVVFLYFIIKNLKIINCLSLLPQKERLIIVCLIIARILKPQSKLSTLSWVKTTAMPLLFNLKIESFHVNEIYKAMDVLYEKIERVMDSFFKANSEEDNSLLLYDITSVFFEGRGPEGLAKYGYSRDRRDDRPQILLVLCLNKDKLPVYFDIIEGNIQDKQTVKPLIDKLKAKYALKGTIFIGDRGMVSIDNLNHLKKNEIDYIVALTHREARELIINKDINPTLFDRQLPVMIHEEDSKKYVLCGSEFRREHEIETLEEMLNRGRMAIETVSQMVKKGLIKDKEKVIRRAQKKLSLTGCDKYYDFKYDNGEFTIIEKKENIEKAKRLCGYYVLSTTKVDMEEEEVEANYKRLKHVEEAFREFKDCVEIRPIFHWKERRVKSHVFICLLAQTVVQRIKQTLKEKGWLGQRQENSFSHFMDILSEISLGIFEIEKARKEVVTSLSEEAKSVINLFGIDKGYFTDVDKIKKEI